MRAEIWVICAGPYDETLATVGDPNFSEQNLKECVVFKKQLEREFGEAPAKSDLIIQSEILESGIIFWNVAIRFDPDDPDASAFADRVENGVARWDQIAIQELGR
jgi:hypothetical protein